MKEDLEGVQGRNLEAGMEAEAMEECGLFFMIPSACFFTQPETNSVGVVPPTVGWALPQQTRKCPTGLPTG